MSQADASGCPSRAAATRGAISGESATLDRTLARANDDVDLSVARGGRLVARNNIHVPPNTPAAMPCDSAVASPLKTPNNQHPPTTTAPRRWGQRTLNLPGRPPCLGVIS